MHIDVSMMTKTVCGVLDGHVGRARSLPCGRLRTGARIGDWVVGLGEKHPPSNEDFSGKVVYAMEVTDKMTMKNYDLYTRERLPEKISDLKNRDSRKWLGDSLYDFALRAHPAQIRGTSTS